MNSTNSRIAVAITVNGTAHELQVPARQTLAECVREELGLTGTHLGCEHGVCGACTVLVDGQAARSCLVLTVQADGATIETVESLANDDTLHAVQQAMVDNHGFQCAFCAPGFLMTIKALIDNQAVLTKATLREELSGNLCRCTGYASILAGAEAVLGLTGESNA